MGDWSQHLSYAPTDEGESRVATFGPGEAYAKDGATFPAIGVGGGAFLGFDDAATETAMWSVGPLIPDTWRTFGVHLETFNPSGDPGANNVVVWKVTVNSGFPDAAAETEQTVTADNQQTIFEMAGGPWTFGSNTVAGVVKYGAVIQLSRLGGDEDDTLDADAHLASLHVVRIT